MISGNFHFHLVSCNYNKADERLRMVYEIKDNVRTYEYGWHTMQGVCV